MLATLRFVHDDSLSAVRRAVQAQRQPKGASRSSAHTRMLRSTAFASHAIAALHGAAVGVSHAALESAAAAAQARAAAGFISPQQAAHIMQARASAAAAAAAIAASPTAAAAGSSGGVDGADGGGGGGGDNHHAVALQNSSVLVRSFFPTSLTGGGAAAGAAVAAAVAAHAAAPPPPPPSIPTAYTSLPTMMMGGSGSGGTPTAPAAARGDTAAATAAGGGNSSTGPDFDAAAAAMPATPRTARGSPIPQAAGGAGAAAAGGGRRTGAAAAAQREAEEKAKLAAEKAATEKAAEQKEAATKAAAAAAAHAHGEGYQSPRATFGGAAPAATTPNAASAAAAAARPSIVMIGAPPPPKIVVTQPPLLSPAAGTAGPGRASLAGVALSPAAGAASSSLSPAAAASSSASSSSPTKAPGALNTVGLTPRNGGLLSPTTPMSLGTPSPSNSSTGARTPGGGGGSAKGKSNRALKREALQRQQNKSGGGLKSPMGQGKSPKTPNSAAAAAAAAATIAANPATALGRAQNALLSPTTPMSPLPSLGGAGAMPQLTPEQQAEVDARAAVAAAEAAAQQAFDDMNSALFTHEAMLKRKLLRNHREVVRELNRFWALMEKHTQPSLSSDPLFGVRLPTAITGPVLNQLPHTGGAGLAKDEYVRVHMRLSKALNPRFQYKPAALLAEEDWLHDSKNGRYGVLDYHMYLDCLFELADLWCYTVDARDYVLFLQALFQRVTMLSVDGEYMWRPIQRIEPLPIAIEREARREAELVRQEREIRFDMKNKLAKQNAALLRKASAAGVALTPTPQSFRPVIERIPSPPQQPGNGETGEGTVTRAEGKKILQLKWSVVSAFFKIGKDGKPVAGKTPRDQRTVDDSDTSDDSESSADDEKSRDNKKKKKRRARRKKQQQEAEADEGDGNDSGSAMGALLNRPNRTVAEALADQLRAKSAFWSVLEDYISRDAQRNKQWLSDLKLQQETALQAAIDKKQDELKQAVRADRERRRSGRPDDDAKLLNAFGAAAAGHAAAQAAAAAAAAANVSGGREPGMGLAAIEPQLRKEAEGFYGKEPERPPTAPRNKAGNTSRTDRSGGQPLSARSGDEGLVSPTSNSRPSTSSGQDKLTPFSPTNAGTARGLGSDDEDNASAGPAAPGDVPLADDADGAPAGYHMQVVKPPTVIAPSPKALAVVAAQDEARRKFEFDAAVAALQAPLVDPDSVEGVGEGEDVDDGTASVTSSKASGDGKPKGVKRAKSLASPGKKKVGKSPKRATAARPTALAPNLLRASTVAGSGATGSSTGSGSSGKTPRSARHATMGAPVSPGKSPRSPKSPVTTDAKAEQDSIDKRMAKFFESGTPKADAIAQRKAKIAARSGAAPDETPRSDESEPNSAAPVGGGGKKLAVSSVDNAAADAEAANQVIGSTSGGTGMKSYGKAAPKSPTTRRRKESDTGSVDSNASGTTEKVGGGGGGGGGGRSGVVKLGKSGAAAAPAGRGGPRSGSIDESESTSASGVDKNNATLSTVALKLNKSSNPKRASFNPSSSSTAANKLKSPTGASGSGARTQDDSALNAFGGALTVNRAKSMATPRGGKQSSQQTLQPPSAGGDAPSPVLSADGSPLQLLSPGGADPSADPPSASPTTAAAAAAAAGATAPALTPNSAARVFKFAATVANKHDSQDPVSVAAAAAAAEAAAKVAAAAGSKQQPKVKDATASPPVESRIDHRVRLERAALRAALEAAGGSGALAEALSPTALAEMFPEAAVYAQRQGTPYSDVAGMFSSRPGSAGADPLSDLAALFPSDSARGKGPVTAAEFAAYLAASRAAAGLPPQSSTGPITITGMDGGGNKGRGDAKQTPLSPAAAAAAAKLFGPDGTMGNVSRRSSGRPTSAPHAKGSKVSGRPQTAEDEPDSAAELPDNNKKPSQYANFNVASGLNDAKSKNALSPLRGKVTGAINRSVSAMSNAYQKGRLSASASIPKAAGTAVQTHGGDTLDQRTLLSSVQVNRHALPSPTGGHQPHDQPSLAMLPQIDGSPMMLAHVKQHGVRTGMTQDAMTRHAAQLVFQQQQRDRNTEQTKQKMLGTSASAPALTKAQQQQQQQQAAALQQQPRAGQSSAAPEPDAPEAADGGGGGFEIGDTDYSSAPMAASFGLTPGGKLYTGPGGVNRNPTGKAAVLRPASEHAAVLPGLTGTAHGPRPTNPSDRLLFYGFDPDDDLKADGGDEHKTMDDETKGLVRFVNASARPRAPTNPVLPSPKHVKYTDHVRIVDDISKAGPVVTRVHHVDFPPARQPTSPALPAVGAPAPVPGARAAHAAPLMVWRDSPFYHTDKGTKILNAQQYSRSIPGGGRQASAVGGEDERKLAFDDLLPSNVPRDVNVVGGAGSAVAARGTSPPRKPRILRRASPPRAASATAVLGGSGASYRLPFDTKPVPGPSDAVVVAAAPDHAADPVGHIEPAPAPAPVPAAAASAVPAVPAANLPPGVTLLPPVSTGALAAAAGGGGIHIVGTANTMPSPKRSGGATSARPAPALAPVPADIVFVSDKLAFRVPTTTTTAPAPGTAVSPARAPRAREKHRHPMLSPSDSYHTLIAKGRPPSMRPNRSAPYLITLPALQQQLQLQQSQGQSPAKS